MNPKESEGRGAGQASALLAGVSPASGRAPLRGEAQHRAASGATGEGHFTTSDFDFALPPELIAQHPAPERSAARLLDGSSAAPVDRVFRDLPALLQPGFRVRFVDIATLSEASRAALAGATVQKTLKPAAPVPGTGQALEVRSPGLLTLLQDGGRPGLAGQGVSASGALDQGACRTANRLVGNASHLACLETVGGGLQLASHGETVVAVTGADAPLTLTTAGGTRHAVPRYQALALAHGDVLAIGAPRAGTRCYVAARGGFDVAPVLGSLSTDTLAHVGPPALVAGDRLALCDVAHGAITGNAELPQDDLPSLCEDVVLDVIPGPRTDWFTPEALALLAGQRWRVTPQSNRVGLRLAGDEPLTRTITQELPSEGTVTGAIQVPASGQPVLFLADHPLTGGYPVIACVAPHHLDRAGQIPVSAWVRFNPIRPFEAINRP